MYALLFRIEGCSVLPWQGGSTHRPNSPAAHLQQWHVGVEVLPHVSPDPVLTCAQWTNTQMITIGTIHGQGYGVGSYGCFLNAKCHPRSWVPWHSHEPYQVHVQLNY